MVVPLLVLVLMVVVGLLLALDAMPHEGRVGGSNLLLALLLPAAALAGGGWLGKCSYGPCKGS